MRRKIDWKQISKYLAGESSEKEEQQILAWMDETPSHREIFESLKKIYLESKDDSLKWDVEKAWQTFKDNASKPSELSRPVRANRSKDSKIQWSIPSFAYGLRIAAVAVLVMGLLYVAQFIFKSGGLYPKKFSLQEVATENSQQATITLSDGTKVRLNCASQLRCPDKFGKNREVFLNGEAYFEVTPNPDKPFIVHTHGSQVKVLGTAFNVKAWQTERRVEVVVSRGVVSFQANKSASQKSVIVEQNHKSTLIEGGDPELPTTVEAEQYLSWLRNELVFNKTPLHEVITVLERRYDLVFNLSDSTFINRRLTASFKNDSIENILKTISLSLNLNYKRSGRIIILSEK